MSSEGSNQSLIEKEHFKMKVIKKKRPSLPPSPTHQKEQSPNNKNKKKSFYYVEDILGKEKINGRLRYLVKWKGYPLQDATWEPAKNLTNAKCIVKNFELKLKIKANQAKKNNKNFEFLEDCEKLKAHKKADNSFFNKIELGSNSEGDSNILGNSQIMFKNTRMLNIDNEKEGDFRLGDKPKKILFARKTKNGILFAVDWQVRENGISPEVSFYDNSQLKSYSPQVLIDFYEENIIFKDEEEDNEIDDNENLI